MENNRQLSLGIVDETTIRNVLPHDGESIYFGPLFAPEDADMHLAFLLNNIPWKHDETMMFGRRITTARKVAWYGDPGCDYTYSGNTKRALAWTPELYGLKERVEEQSGSQYNSCLLNLYSNGEQGMGWHQDNEAELGENPIIASLSFGATRRFDFRHKESREKVSVMLEHGSLLLMKGGTQENWQHQLPKTKKVLTPRVNLTFRTIAH